VYVGWFQNSRCYANGYLLRAKDWSVKEKGWFEGGERKEEFKECEQYPVFNLEEVFLKE